ncbi:pilus assembly protein CpaE [Sphingomonas sp. BIUV-7]|uniref:Pilus assembly protein CpaE n=1 Tax=Sphingomonas natans TaxID=3063330 RepID=A0ABT8Y591_9SPHN|nr:pilus assembly protein CpaE [Sphingomonas sp. BIUV-7]MDO6413172.1 pilus assembly protein CpaE [Sphingomonas sp. BIUV-7]
MNAPFNPHLALRDPFSAFLSDEESDHVVRNVASGMGWPLERIHDGGIRYAVQTLAVSASPNLLLIDLSESSDPLEDINGLAEVCEPGTIVLACGRVNDVRFYRHLISSGIQDYLLKPFTEDQLHEAIVQAQTLQNGQREADASDEAPHIMTAVVGVRGGVGASTLAVSTAWLLAETRNRQTALLDLDVHFGTGALALDLEPGRGLTDAIENPSRIDGLFLERALVRATARLGVLSAEAPMHQPLSGDGTSFFQLQEELRNTFACTVIDLPRHMLIAHPALLQAVGVVVVVTELTLAATRDTIRLLSWLKSNAPQARIVLVANRVPAGGVEEISRKDFESSIERQIDLAIGYDAKAVSDAAKLGKPLAESASNSKTGQLLGTLATLVIGEEATQRKTNKSLMGRLGDLRAHLPRKRRA